MACDPLKSNGNVRGHSSRPERGHSCPQQIPNSPAAHPFPEAPWRCNIAADRNVPLRLVRITFYAFSIKARNSANNVVESCGPGEASGWYWTQKTGLFLCRIPSTV